MVCMVAVWDFKVGKKTWNDLKSQTEGVAATTCRNVSEFSFLEREKGGWPPEALERGQRGIVNLQSQPI